MPTDTTVNNLVINKMTKAQYDSLVNPSATELYLVPDEMDTTPTSGSTNPVTSNGIYTALNTLSGDIPTKTSDLTNDGSDGTSYYVEANELAAVATTNSYNDLDDKPTIPSIAGLAQDSAVVHITGNEQIRGAKTFLDTAIFDASITIDNNLNKGVYIDSEYDQSNEEPVLNFWGDYGDERVRLSNIEEPRYDTDAATKYYVDHHGGGGGSYDGNSYVFYGTCSTAAATVAKDVVCQDFTSSDLVEGVMVIVKFSATNSGAVANLTLNVNGTGAKGIRKIYTTSGVTTLTNAAELAVNATIPFIYNGTYWVVAGLDYNTNTNTIGYQLRTNSSTRKTTDGFRYYKILFTSADGTHWVPASATKNNSATTEISVNQRPINPFGEIVCYGYTTNYNAEDTVSGTYTWQQYTLTLGYSFNRIGTALTLTTQTPVYIKCAPQSDGSAIIDADTPYVQSLPSTDDGKIYIFLGIAYSATAVEMTMNHPVYQYKDGKIICYTGSYLSNKDLVHTTGNEYIGGIKTFNDDVIARSSLLLWPESNNIIPIWMTSDPYVTVGGVNYAVLQLGDSLNDNPVLLRGVHSPIVASDAVNKSYLDNIVGDIETLLAAI